MGYRVHAAQLAICVDIATPRLLWGGLFIFGKW